MPLFESNKDRMKRLRRELTRSGRKLEVHLMKMDENVKKTENEAVEYAKTGQKSRLASASRRLRTLMLRKRGLERRRDLIEDWVIQTETVGTDQEIGDVLSRIAGVMKLPTENLEKGIESFTEKMDDHREMEDVWLRAEQQAGREANLNLDDEIPSEDDLMNEILSKAGAERESEARVASQKTSETSEEIDETQGLRERARNKIGEDNG